MAVYVDQLMHYVEEGIFKQGSCHMWADTVEQLHFFANSLGLKRSCFQQKHHKSGPGLPHYDLTPSKREKAVALGAKEMDFREAMNMWADMGYQPHKWMRDLRERKQEHWYDERFAL